MKPIIKLLFILLPVFVFGQSYKTNDVIQKKWTEVERLKSIGNHLESKGLLNELKEYARLTNNEAIEMRVFLAEKDVISANLNWNDAFNKIEKHFEENIKKASTVKKSLLYQFYANFLGGYLEHEQGNNNKFLTAALDDRLKIIDSIFKKSIEHKSILLKESIQKWEYLTKDSEKLDFTPTLYHYNLNNYLTFLLGDYKKNKPLYDELLQNIISINKNKSYEDATAFLLSKKVEYKNNEEFVSAYEQIISQTNSNYNAYLYGIIGDKFERNNDSLANIYFKKGIDQYPNSPWRKDLDSSILKIKQVLINFSHNSVIPINEYEVLNLTTQNTDTVFIKVFKIPYSPNNWSDIDKLRDTSIQTIKNYYKEVYTEEIPLKKFRNYKEHSTVYKIDPLSAGKYLLLLSNNKFFENEGVFKVVANSIFTVSDLYLNTKIDRKKDNEKEFIGILVNRKTGIPYKNKTIRTYLKHITKSAIPFSTIKTNNAGSFSISVENDSIGRLLSKNLELFIEEEDLLIANQETQDYSDIAKGWKTEENTFNGKILLDRKVFRPNQKLYFKGIIYRKTVTDSQISSHTPYKVKLKSNHSGQIIDSLICTSNTFGSINGNFLLKTDLLPGSYSISILDKDIQIGNESFKIEEYKLPTFKVSLDPITATYSQKDTVLFAGKVLSYSGAALPETIVRADITVITHRNDGKVDGNNKYIRLRQDGIKTDQQGVFKIKLPLSDTALIKHQAFSIIVNVSATSPTGESKNASSFYIYSTKPWKIEMDNPDMDEGDWNKIIIKTQNENQKPLKLDGSISIYKKKDPPIIFPNLYTRTYEKPFRYLNYHLLSEQEYKLFFPKLYGSDVDYINQDSLIVSYKFDTRISDTIKIDPKLFSSGEYLIKAESILGMDTVRGYDFVTIYDSTTAKVGNKNFLVYKLDKKRYQVNDKVKIKFSTDFKAAKELIIMQSDMLTHYEYITVPFKDGLAEFETIFDQQKLKYGYRINALLIQENNVKTIDIEIPFITENKTITISVETFRDKIAPGEKEKWKFNLKSKNGSSEYEMLATMYNISVDEISKNRYSNNFEFTERNSSFGVRFGYVYLNHHINSIGPEKSNYYNNFPDIQAVQFYNYGLWDLNWLNRGDVFKSSRNVVYDFESVWQPEFLLSDRRYKNEEFGLNIDNVVPIKFEKLNQVQARTNLQETAFFYPTLYTDKDGNISFEFDSPEALTTWKLLLFAHGKNLEVGSGQFVTQTQKQLMVRPNLPRYFRESDEIELISQIQNLSDQAQQGQAKIEIINPVDNSVITDKFVISPVTTDFRVEKSSNQTVSWKLKIPEGYPTVHVKVVAASEAFSDGEAQELPILSNKVLISETEKITLKAGENRTFEIDAAGKDNLQAKVQVQSNPILEIISAIDYLKNYPYECTEQTSSKWFGLKMVQYIGKNYPVISAYFKTIKSRETKSRLEENAELSELKLQEMPWLRDIQHDDKRIDQLAELFNTNIGSELNSLEQKLIRSQLDNGAFPWFEGGKEDQHISTRILEIVGKVYNLDPTLVDSDLNGSMKKLAGYLDRDSEITKPNSSATLALDYLYARHFWNSEVKVPEDNKQVLKTKIAKAPLITAKGPAGYAAKAWIVNQLFGDSKEANEIKNRIQQEVILDPEKGMYWESNGKSYNDISLHSYLLEAYRLYDPSKLNQISQWIFYRKEANYWRSTWSTVDAIYSLLLTNNPKDFSLDNNVTVLVDGQRSTMDSVVLGQVSRTFDGEELSSNRSVQVQNHNDRPVFGGVFHQYFLPVSEVRSSTNDLKVSKQYMVERNGKWVESNEAKLGEKIKIVITVINDQNLEYVHLKDSRPAGVEPVFVPSGYNWRNNYYFTLKDASTNYFFGNLAKGKRTFEYEVKANNIGVFNSGITTIESMYDPTVNARSDNKVITIVK